MNDIMNILRRSILSNVTNNCLRIKEENKINNKRNLTMSIFGPENTKVYVVDSLTGEISHYMTSEDAAEADAKNGDCFLTKFAANAKSEEIKNKVMEIKLINGEDMDKHIYKEAGMVVKPKTDAVGETKEEEADFIRFAGLTEEENIELYKLSILHLGDATEESWERYRELYKKVTNHLKQHLDDTE